MASLSLLTAPDQIGITKVALEAMVGRAAREVVQVRSVMAPYAVRVVRTITIERSNSGAVLRTDSGWQAVTDGSYDFPANTTHPIVTHPGVVTTATNVKNIRDLGSLVCFDCTLQLENSVGAIKSSHQMRVAIMWGSTLTPNRPPPKCATAHTVRI